MQRIAILSAAARSLADRHSRAVRRLSSSSRSSSSTSSSASSSAGAEAEAEAIAIAIAIAIAAIVIIIIISTASIRIRRSPPAFRPSPCPWRPHLRMPGSFAKPSRSSFSRFVASSIYLSFIRLASSHSPIAAVFRSFLLLLFLSLPSI
jgi:hypothetical protein